MAQHNSLEDRLAAIETTLSNMTSMSLQRYNIVTSILGDLLQKSTKLTETLLEHQNVIQLHINRTNIDTKEDVNVNSNQSTHAFKIVPESAPSDVTAAATIEKESVNEPLHFQPLYPHTEKVENPAELVVDNILDNAGILCGVSIDDSPEYYLNWEKKHNVLREHAYVPALDYTNIIVKLYIAISRDVTEVEQVSKEIIEMINMSCKLDKYTRFSNGGVFLNINTPVVQTYLSPILNVIYKKEYHDLTVMQNTYLQQLIGINNNIILNELDGLHNRTSFEEKYNLIWNSKKLEQFTHNPWYK